MKDKVPLDDITCERLVWLASQTGKIAEILKIWEQWQWDDIDDTGLREKVGEILFRDYPKEVIQIPASKPIKQI